MYGVVGGELSLAGQAQAVDVEYAPDSQGIPARQFMRLNIDSLGVRAFSSRLALERVEPLAAIFCPASSYDASFNEDLSGVVSHPLGMSEMNVVTQNWCQMRLARNLRRFSVQLFSQPMYPDGFPVRELLIKLGLAVRDV